MRVEKLSERGAALDRPGSLCSRRGADEILREGIFSGTERIAHQAIVEFVAATTRGKIEDRLLEVADARRESEELMAQFPTIYPDDGVLRMTLRGTAAYGLS